MGTIGCKLHSDSYSIRHKTAIIFPETLKRPLCRSSFTTFLRQSSTVTKPSHLVLKCQITSINLIPNKTLASRRRERNTLCSKQHVTQAYIESTLTNENFVIGRIKHILEVTCGQQFFPRREKTGNVLCL